MYFRRYYEPCFDEARADGKITNPTYDYIKEFYNSNCLIIRDDDSVKAFQSVVPNSFIVKQLDDGKYQVKVMEWPHLKLMCLKFAPINPRYWRYFTKYGNVVLFEYDINTFSVSCPNASFDNNSGNSSSLEFNELHGNIGAQTESSDINCPNEAFDNNSRDSYSLEFKELHGNIGSQTESSDINCPNEAFDNNSRDSYSLEFNELHGNIGSQTKLSNIDYDKEDINTQTESSDIDYDKEDVNTQTESSDIDFNERKSLSDESETESSHKDSD